MTLQGKEEGLSFEIHFILHAYLFHKDNPSDV